MLSTQVTSNPSETIQPKNATPLNPELLWAQRSNLLYLTIHIQDVEGTPKIELSETQLLFSGMSHGQWYETRLEFYDLIDVEKSRFEVNPRQIFFVLMKKSQGEEKEMWWPRFLKSKQKLHYLKTDFSRWRDEDEEEEEEERDGNLNPDMDMFGLGGQGGMDLNQAQMMQSMLGGAGFQGGNDQFNFQDFANRMGSSQEEMDSDDEEEEQVSQE